MKKRLIITSSLVILGLALMFILAPKAKTNYKAYYSGDAIEYRGQLIIASTDSGALEIFRQNGNSLERSARLKTDTFLKNSDFSSVKLEEESGRLVAYATAGYNLYRYDLSNVSKPVLLNKSQNTYYDWYQRVDKFGNNIVTASQKGVKVWRTDGTIFDVVDSYPVVAENPLSIRFDAAGRYIVTISQDNLVHVYDAQERREISSFPVNYRSGSDQKRLQFDSLNKEILVFDDYYLKRFSLTGKLLVHYPNSALNGYGVEASGHPDYIYAANGESVMRLAKSNLRDGRKVGAYNLTPNGWAMGLKYVNIAGQDRLVVFNGGGIAVLNSSLTRLASVQATEIAEVTSAKEALALELESYAGVSGSKITLRAYGYVPGEVLTVNFGGTITERNADSNGRLNTTLTVPQIPNQVVAVKVTGQNSNLSYSTTFQVK